MALLKFAKSEGSKLELNQNSLPKQKKLLGIKDYYTVLEEQIVSNVTIMERYHVLYKIEQAFRVSKAIYKLRPSLSL